MGRPPKPEAERLSISASVRFTTPEYDAIIRRAREARLSIRAYLREVMRRDIGLSGVKT